MNAARYVVGLALLLVAAPARGSDFEQLAATAQRVTHLDDVLWPLTATCDQGDDVAQRQCRQVRDRAAAELRTHALLLIDGDPASFDVDRWSAPKKSIRSSISGCIDCRGLAIDQHTWFVVAASTPPRVEAGVVRAAMIAEQARPFPDDNAATAWSKSVANHRVQLLVKVPERPRLVVGGKQVFGLEVVGYRVITPCNGEVVIANPASPPIAPDKAACTAGDPVGVAARDGVDQLTAAMVKEALAPVVTAAGACHDKFGVAGAAKLELVISGDGTIASYRQGGDFVGTPTADCIDAAVKMARFPRSKKATTKLAYPIVLQ